MSTVPDLMLEKMAAGEATPAEQERLRGRYGDALETRLGELATADREFLTSYSPVQMVAGINERYDLKRRKRRMRLAVTGMGMAASAAVLVLVVSVTLSDSAPFGEATSRSSTSSTLNIAPTPPGEGGHDRIKAGDPGLFIYRNGDAGQEKLSSGATAAAGDVLQLQFSAGSARHVMIASVDGRGTVTLHYPQNTGDSTRVEPGQKVVLPYAYELDDAPEYERFFLVWSNDKELDAARVLEQLEKGKGPKGTLSLSGKFEYRDFMLQKKQNNE